MKSTTRYVLLAALCCALAAGGASAAVSATKAPTNVKVATGFFPNVIFTPYYVAIARGYYAHEGLNVSMNYDRVPNLLQSVADGAYAFGASSGDSALIGRDTGARIKYVMAQYTQYPVGAMWLKHGGPTIKKPSDLKGLRIGISSPGSATDFGLKALLKAGHLTESDVTVTAVGFAETDALIHHQIDVAMTFTDNEPVQARALGYPVNVMKVSKYFRLTPNGVVTSQSLFNSNPNEVKGFVKATLRGQAFTLAHPDKAFKIALKFMPDLVDPKDIAIQRKVLTARLAYQQPISHEPLGWSNPKNWLLTRNFLKSIGALQHQVNPASVFTNKSVNQVNLHVTTK
ncbi:MAG TPA: ABC transporter substrate-binding protein [Gaiellaceae bacterium]|jgi:NitT/TauT family transport system substrate-binding protein